MTGLPRPATGEGQAGLDALLADPGHALIATDFDGTLAPTVPTALAKAIRAGTAPG